MPTDYRHVGIKITKYYVLSKIKNLIFHIVLVNVCPQYKNSHGSSPNESLSCNKRPHTNNACILCLQIYKHVSTVHILSTARGFKKIAGKGGGAEYLILNLYLPRGYVKSNIQSDREYNQLQNIWHLFSS